MRCLIVVLVLAVAVSGCQMTRGALEDGIWIVDQTEQVLLDHQAGQQARLAAK